MGREDETKHRGIKDSGKRLNRMQKVDKSIRLRKK
jgi:hypothetical protein